MKKQAIRLLSVLLSAALLIGLMPFAAFAVTTEEMESAQQLTLDESASVSITVSGEIVYFKFTPTATDFYSFYSSGTCDTMGYIYNNNGSEMVQNDDASTGGAGNRNFLCETELSAGKTYYFGAKLYSTYTGNFSVCLSQTHYSDSWTETVPATCTSSGTETAVCSYCGADLTRVIEALPHQYGERTVVTEPTCTAAGVETAQCTMCGKTGEFSIPSLGHNYSKWTYNGDGTHSRTCSRCGLTQSGNCSLDTFTKAGVEKRYCTVCDYAEYSETGEKEIAFWDFEQNTNGWTFLDADGDGKTWFRSTGGSAHTGQGYITSSYRFSGSVDDWAISPAFSLAGVDNAGLSVYVKQGDNYVEKFALYAGTSANPDSMTALTDVITAQTSHVLYKVDLSGFAGEETVYIAIRHLESENQLYLYADDITVFYTSDAACSNHVLEEMGGDAPTCTQSGVLYSTFYKCDTCGRYYLDAEGTQPIIPDDIQAAALGHIWGEYTVTSEATCTDNGYKVRTCQRCGTTDTTIINATGHNWGTRVSNNDGTHTATCLNNCGESKTDECSYNVSTENGIAVYTCSECGYTYISEIEQDAPVYTWNFEGGKQGWTFIDADRDGNNWQWGEDEYFSYKGTGFIQSYSYNSDPLTPDNLAVSPAFSLEGLNSAKVSFWATTSSGYPADVFAVYAGPENNMVKVSEDFVGNGRYTNYTADISQFAGMNNICIGIRHYNCTDQYYVAVDNVEILTEYTADCEHELEFMPANETATCTEPMHSTPYYLCLLCGRTYLDADGTQPVLLSSISEAPAAGHLWGDAVSNNDGTHTQICSRCNMTQTKSCVYNTVQENGVEKNTCLVCGYSITEAADVNSTLISWDFEDSSQGWTFTDADGDGFNFLWSGSKPGFSWKKYNGSGMLVSASYDGNSSEPLEPDNWAASPAFSLKDVSSAAVSLHAVGQDDTDFNEVFALYAGTTPDPANMTKISEDYITDVTYGEFSADLSDFAGEGTVYVAIRHYNCTDMFWLVVDEVTISTVVLSDCAHELEYMPANETATCTEPGHSTPYYQCSLCGRFFLDAEGTQPVIPSDIVETPALGHSWQAPEWEWADDYSSATAVFTCANGCGETSAVETGEVMLRPGETSETVVFTATVSYEGTEYTGTITVNAYQAVFFTDIYDDSYYSETLPENRYVSEPVKPVVDGYVFGGWYVINPDAGWYEDGDGIPYVDSADGETSYSLPVLLANWNEYGAENYFIRWDFDNDRMPGEDITFYAKLTEKEDIEVYTHSLTLNGDIGVNFYVAIPGLEDGACAEFTVDGETVTVPVDPDDFLEAGGKVYYKLSAYVNAPQIDTVITGVIHNGNSDSEEFTYSVGDYLTEAQQTMGGDEKLMALASSIATYGYYANELLGYDDQLEKHALFDDSGMQAVTAESLADYAAQMNGTENGVVYYGSSLVLRSATAIRHYFTLPEGKTIDDFTFTCGDQTLTPEANGEYYFVEISDIPAAELGDAFTVTVTDSENNVVNTWIYSALSYAYKALTIENASEELTNAVKALIIYYQTAAQYFAKEES